MKFTTKVQCIVSLLSVALSMLAPSNLAARTTRYSVGPTISVGNSPYTAVITPNGSEVYVSNYGSDTVSVIDASTDTVIATIAVGSGPDALAVSPDGSKVYVGQNGGDVSVINTLTKAVSTIPAGAPIRDLAITPDGTKIYLAMEYQGLKRVDTASNSVSTVSSITCPEGVAVTPDGQFLYVNYQCFGPGGSAGHDAIGKFAVSTDTFLLGITGFPNVGSKIVVSPDGKRIWAANVDACSSPSYDHVGCPVVPQGVVNVISTATDKLLQSLGSTGRVGLAPNNSFVLLGGSQLMLLKSSASLVGLVNVAGSGSLAVTPNGKKAYVPTPGSNVVTIITIGR